MKQSRGRDRVRFWRGDRTLRRGGEEDSRVDRGGGAG
jgi:hypothetical protein